MKRHIISQPAIKDLENIVDYFSRNNLKAGENFIDEFEKKCQYLAQFPNIGRSYDDLKQSLRGLNFDIANLNQLCKQYWIFVNNKYFANVSIFLLLTPDF